VICNYETSVQTTACACAYVRARAQPAAVTLQAAANSIIACLKTQSFSIFYDPTFPLEIRFICCIIVLKRRRNSNCKVTKVSFTLQKGYWSANRLHCVLNSQPRSATKRQAESRRGKLSLKNPKDKWNGEAASEINSWVQNVTYFKSRSLQWIQSLILLQIF